MLFLIVSCSLYFNRKKDHDLEFIQIMISESEIVKRAAAACKQTQDKNGHLVGFEGFDFHCVLHACFTAGSLQFAATEPGY